MPTFHLICTEPFKQYRKGDIVTDPAEVAKHINDREHHFIRIAAPDENVPPPPPEENLP